MTQEKGQEECRIWEKYGELLSEEEKAVLRAAQPQNTFPVSERRRKEAKATLEKLNTLESCIFHEIDMSKLYCKGYLFVVACAWYFNNLGRNANVLFSFIFVLCIWRILSRRRRNCLDNNHIQKSCLYLSVVFLVWTLQVICFSGSYRRIFIFPVLAFFISGLIFVFRKRPFNGDFQNGLILLLEYILVFFFLFYITQLTLIPVYPLFALIIKKCIDSCRNALNEDVASWCDKFSHIRSYRIHRIHGIFMLCLLVDTFRITLGSKIPVEALSFDARPPLYIMVSVLLIQEIFAQILAQKYDIIKTDELNKGNDL